MTPTVEPVPPREQDIGLVYVIVINWNQADLTIDCLASVFRSEQVRLKVVVVDNGSTDGSVAKIRAALPEGEVLIAGENVGYSEGNNLGIRHALEKDPEYILLLNNDTLVDPYMLRCLVEAAESDAHIGITGPTQFYFDQPDIIWGAANYVIWQAGTTMRSRMGEKMPLADGTADTQRLIEADYIDTCAALVRAEVFRTAGLLDRRYFINFDDADLGLRAKKAGFRVVYQPSAKMWHKVSAAMGQASPATTYYMTRNQLLLFLTHSGGFNRLLAIAKIVLRTVRTILAWSSKPVYRRDDLFQRRRNANLFALRDFALRRFEKMGPDVARACSGR